MHPYYTELMIHEKYAGFWVLSRSAPAGDIKQSDRFIANINYKHKKEFFLTFLSQHEMLQLHKV